MPSCTYTQEAYAPKPTANSQAAACDRQTLTGHGRTFKQVRNCYSSIVQRAQGSQRRYDIFVELSSTSKEKVHAKHLVHC